MRYAVLACPSCRRVQAVELRHQRVSCRACGKGLVVADLRALWRGDNEREVTAVVQRVSAQAGGMAIDDYARLLASQEKESPGSIEEALAELSSLERFDRDDFEAAIRRRRVPGDAERLLAGLLASNQVYEPRPGTYRAA